MMTSSVTANFVLALPFLFPHQELIHWDRYIEIVILKLSIVTKDRGAVYLTFMQLLVNDTPRPGHLYMVEKKDAVPLWDLGDIWEVDTSGNPVNNITEVDAISFNPTTNVLWGWGQHTRLSHKKFS
jgi:hypothetical protein